MNKIRVLIADDEPLAQQGIALMLQDDPEVTLVATVGDGAAALAAVRAVRPDLVFLDVQMPQLGGLSSMAGSCRRSGPR